MIRKTDIFHRQYSIPEEITFFVYGAKNSFFSSRITRSKDDLLRSKKRLTDIWLVCVMSVKKTTSHVVLQHAAVHVDMDTAIRLVNETRNY